MLVTYYRVPALVLQMGKLKPRETMDLLKVTYLLRYEKAKKNPLGLLASSLALSFFSYKTTLSLLIEYLL